ncbi:hypothetical protein ACFV6Z_18700 [Streptomyces sp. NPDC059818]|uniref:hypothetical protein n=1 Tax=Streptomyces sp. NPDC059818 TaxID=3346962 RepID=UPI0036694138
MSEARRPLPADPLECRQNAEQLLAQNEGDDPVAACAWALLAVAAELATIRRSRGR